MEFQFCCAACDSNNTKYEWIESVGFDVECNDCEFIERRYCNKANIDIDEITINMGGARVALNNLNKFELFSRLGRNDRCACGSGKKFKKCCININWEVA